MFRPNCLTRSTGDGGVNAQRCRRWLQYAVAGGSGLNRTIGKSLDDWNDLFGRIFHDPMSGVGNPMNFRCGKDLSKTIEKMWREAPIAHAPDQGRRQLSQAR